MQKENKSKNRKKLKAGFVVILFLLSATIISSASLMITDKEIRFKDIPLRIVRYNETTKELEAIYNLTVFNLIINGDSIFNGNSTICNTSQNHFEGNLTIGSSTDYIHINESGILTLHGEARVEKEKKFDMLMVQEGDEKPHRDKIRIGDVVSKIKVNAYSFDPSSAIDEEIWFAWHIPYDLDPSEDIEFHVSWKTKDTWVSGSYNWSLDYIIKHDDEVNNTGTPITIWSNSTPVNADSFIEIFFSTKITGATNDDMIFCRFYLDSSGSTATVDGHVLFLEFKYYVNKLGERGLT